ncbi:MULTISPECIES: class I SAM-dependent methyltransferase [unclassified Ectothiorhodospira]|uniref:class I SAM-dependent methyltransferase n=1 Tax=unclassified Ectothiorhodospira TaxID=2684909 RepID=UPI001EE81693|nr:MULTISPECIES: class I SAM-dependent methyltransferase [unclassified Ectothiorhodospira]MCG5517210.1 class I SAM-dependent methyltransferase [Ectothiorhodospira sp. 9100]MCG5520134.1 class I SAM-dependent methyltransferase [Ectothiorhodospira sp. 9905]
MAASTFQFFRHIALELLARGCDERTPEPDLVMADPEQADSFRMAGREDGTIAPTYLFHTLQLSQMIRPGDLVVDLASGPANQLAQVARMNPQARFVGVDASDSMLELAEEHIKRQGIGNVSFERSYIQSLGTFSDGAVDVVMSTMSLHHLPDYETLEATFREVARILKPGGALYIADFGRMKRDATRQFFAEQHADRQPPIFTVDYLNSLRAAFRVDDLKKASLVLGEGVSVKTTALVPFMVLIMRGHGYTLPESVVDSCGQILRRLPREQKEDFRDLVRFFKMGGVSAPSLRSRY